MLGPEQPDTSRTVVDRARSLYEEAGPVLREALELQRRVLGAEHPDTLRTMTLLADHYIHFAAKRHKGRFCEIRWYRARLDVR